MRAVSPLSGSAHIAAALGLASLAALAPMPVSGQPPTNAAMEKKAGVWIEGPGYDITYGGTYESCAARCLGTQRCVQIEFYRPERKCNLYATVRPLRSAGDSDVGTRRAAPPAADKAPAPEPKQPK